ncbi:MAG: hypothetical protein WCL17_01595 [Actinomycetota bacterium]|jgi:hypothetical protein
MRHEIEVSISCSECVRRDTPDCQGCLVSFVLGGAPDSLELTASEAAVVELLTREQMIPRLRFEPVISEG